MFLLGSATLRVFLEASSSFAFEYLFPYKILFLIVDFSSESGWYRSGVDSILLALLF